MVESSLNITANTPNSSMSNYPHTVLQNASHGCDVMVLSQLEFLPWDNPDNIVSAEVEATVQRIKNLFLVFLFLIGGPGNLINMVVYYKQGLKDRVNLCLFALSFSDLLYLIMAMFHYAEQVHLQFTTKETFGPLMTFFTNNRLTGLLGTAYVSFILSAIIASERCLCVLYPLKFQALMPTRTMAAIIFMLYVVIISLYSVVTFRFQIGCIFDPESGAVFKTAVMGEFYRNHKQLIDHLDAFLFSAIIPITVVIVVMTTTIITVVKLRQIVTWRAGTTSSLSPREIALTKMLVGNSILFLACVSPNVVFRFSWLLFPEMNSGQRHHNFYLTSIWLTEMLDYINSSLNIVVYFVMGSRYRETFKSIFVRKQQPVKHAAESEVSCEQLSRLK